MTETIWQPGMTLEVVEKEIIQKALRYFQGNKTQTAISLGIAIRTLDAKLEQYEKEKQANVALEEERHKRNLELQTRARGGERFISQFSPEAQAGVGVQSTEKVSPEHAVSMPKRDQVQEMPSPKVSGNSSRKAR